MIPGLLDRTPTHLLPANGEPSVLIVVNNPIARFTMASQLLTAGFSVTTSGAYGVVERLEETNYDLMVAAQSLEEMAHFGVPQLARSMQPHLPILVLEADVAAGPGMVEAVQRAIERWPLRARPARQYH